MKKYDITVEELAYQAGFSPKTIGSMRNDVEYTPELEPIIALCIGMQANPFDVFRSCVYMSNVYVKWVRFC